MNKKRIFVILLAIAAFSLITFTGIKYSQSFLRMLPLYISLSVMLLQTKANRYSFLIGGLNSILYKKYSKELLRLLIMPFDINCGKTVV